MELAADSLLREIEEMAEALDRLDRQALSTDGTYIDEVSAAAIAAKRSRLLLELEVAGVFAVESSDVGAKLTALNVRHLREYHDAARAMTEYFASPHRARLVGTPTPERINDARVSLDWFRRSPGYTPPGADPLAWLALCETNFVANERPAFGVLFVRLEGKFHRLAFRTEVGPLAKLYRADPG